MSKEQADAAAIAAVVAAEEAEVAARAAQTQRLKDEAAADLASAMPALEAAVKVQLALEVKVHACPLPANDVCTERLL